MSIFWYRETIMNETKAAGTNVVKFYYMGSVQILLKCWKYVYLTANNRLRGCLQDLCGAIWVGYCGTEDHAAPCWLLLVTWSWLIWEPVLYIHITLLQDTNTITPVGTEHKWDGIGILQVRDMRCMPIQSNYTCQHSHYGTKFTNLWPQTYILDTFKLHSTCTRTFWAADSNTDFLLLWNPKDQSWNFNDSVSFRWLQFICSWPFSERIILILSFCTCLISSLQFSVKNSECITSHLH